LQQLVIMANIDRDNVLRVLGSNKGNLTQDYGLLKLGVFGLESRNEAEAGYIDI